jgi:hypothetical protein
VRSSDIEEKLNAWRDSENAASEVEAELRNIGQGASDPRAAELYARARDLRQRADQMLADIVQALREATDSVVRRQPKP